MELARTFVKEVELGLPLASVNREEGALCSSRSPPYLDPHIPPACYITPVHAHLY